MGLSKLIRDCALTFSCLKDLKFLRMRYVAAYLLCALGGNDSPSAKDLEKVLSSVGIEAGAAQIKKVIDELKGKNVEELIEAGSEKLASVPVVVLPLLPEVLLQLVVTPCCREK